MPLITDPFFYLVAIPAVLLLGVSKSGFGAGFGSLAVPLMALAVTVPQAAAMLMPVLLVMDLLGLHAFRRHFDWKLIRFLVPFGLLGTVVGTLLFSGWTPAWWPVLWEFSRWCSWRSGCCSRQAPAARIRRAGSAPS